MTKILPIGFSLLLLVVADLTHGFINIESLRQNLKKGFYGSSGLQVSGASGNNEVFELGANSQNIYKTQSREYLLISNYKYGEASGAKNTHQGDFHLRFAQQIHPAYWWEIFTQVEFNEFQNLSLRNLGGGGLRLRLINGENTSLFSGLGLFYENENIENDSDQANFRGNIYLSLRSLVTQSLETILVLYYQPNFENISDHRFRVSAGMEIDITKTWSMMNSLNYSFDSRPPKGIQKQDLSFSFGLNYSY